MEDIKLIYYLWLTKIKGIGPVTSRKEFKYSDLERNIINEIKKKNLSLDEISIIIRENKNELMSSILNLELHGILQNIAGIYRITTNR